MKSRNKGNPTHKQSGITSIEYALVGLAMAIIVSLVFTSGEITTALNSAINQVDTTINQSKE